MSCRLERAAGNIAFVNSLTQSERYPMDTKDANGPLAWKNHSARNLPDGPREYPPKPMFGAVPSAPQIPTEGT